MASAAEAIFERELLNLRLSGALLSAFQTWTAQAVSLVLSGGVDVQAAFAKTALLAAVPDELEPVAGDYFDDLVTVRDVVDVLTEIRNYAGTVGLSEDATRALMTKAVAVDRGVFVPAPTAVLAQTRVSTAVPVLVNAGSPTLPQHPAILAPDAPFAEVGHTYRTRLEQTARTASTALQGQLARIEAEVLGKDLRWITVGDDRVRHTHAAAQGQTVSADEWFTVGGIPMEFPGDPHAPIDETINCRCVLTLVDPPQRRYVQKVPSAWLNASGSRKANPRSDAQPEPLFDIDEGAGERQRWETYAERGRRLAAEAADPANPSLTAAAPNQARAPKGTLIGGQWIDTPNAILHALGWEGEAPDSPTAAYTVPETRPPDWEPRTYDQALTEKMPPLTEEQAWAVQQYTGQAYVPLQALNRGDPIPDAYSRTLEDPQAVIDAVDSAFSPIPGDAQVWRGAGGYLTNPDPDGLVGAVLADEAWLSTTVNPVGTGPFAGWGPDKGILKINVPKGTPVIWPGTSAAVSGEFEMILPKNTPLAITGWYKDASGTTVYEATVANPSSLVAAAPGQARAPKGTPIGGQWIDTPLTILEKITLEAKGLPVPEEPEYPNAQALADEYGARLEEAWGDPNLDVAINGISGGDQYGTKFMGVITDQDGNRVGDFERTFYPDGHVYHDQFRLVEEYQGRGMGSKMQAVSEDFYRELGYDRIELRAGLDVGAYTWARQGYEFDGQLTAYDVAYYAWDSIGRMPGVSPAARQQANDIFARAQAEAAAAGDADTSYVPSDILPAEIAAIGWTPGAETWPGKEVLLGYEWHGVKHLNPSSVTADAMPVTDRALALGAIHRGWVTEASYVSRPVPYDADSWYPATEEDVYPTGGSDADYWTLALQVLTPTVANPSLIAAAPQQARAPKGTPIGGEWIETPGALLQGIGVRMTLTRGFASTEVLIEARAIAIRKEQALPEPTDADRAAAAARHGRSKREGGDDRPGSKRRKVLRQKLLDEFGDGQTCPCLNCGRVLDITTVSMDRIIPGADNGRYVPANLIPMDYDCNRARSDDDFDDMAGTWAANPSSVMEPVVPPGTRVRARVSGWGVDESGDLGGADDAPSLEGVPEWVEGPLAGQAVPGYWKHIVDGYDVDPASVEET